MRTFIFMLLLLPWVAKAQIHFDFESDSLTGWKQFPSGRWDTSSVQALNGKFSLKHIFDNKDAGCDKISYPLKGLNVDSGNATWTFTIRHGYNPSSSNNWLFYLISDGDASQMQSANGYAAGVNYNSSDDILKLYKISEGSAAEIINSGINWEKTFGTGNKVTLSVSRKISGEWTLSAELRPDSLATLGSAIDEEFLQASFMGICYKYTSTADMKLWLDDISVNGIFIADTNEPMINDVSVLSSRELLVTFSETVMMVSKNNFYLADTLHRPDSVAMQSDKTVYLHFSDPFPGRKKQAFNARGISDLSGNILQAQSLSFIYNQALPYDIVINEIMSDPDPAVVLPDYEFLELLNRSSYPVQLRNWKIKIGSDIRILPTWTMTPNSYLILSNSSGCSKFKDYGNCLAALSSVYSLNNDGECIELSDPEGKIISSVCYDLSLYTDAAKSNGGWSLEQIDPSRACAAQGNWAVSKDPSGGTPGRKNSVNADNPDVTAPYVTEINVLSDSCILISFSENIDTSILNNPKSFYIEPDAGYPSKCICKNGKDDTLMLSSHLSLNNIYHLKIKTLFGDCSGNMIDTKALFPFALPVSAGSGDIIINEILFHSRSGCPEFVEIYNKSENVINIGKIMIARKDILSGTINSTARIARQGAYVFPKEYLVVTSDSTSLKNFYTCGGRFLQVKEMPSLDDNESIISFLNADESMIDELHYRDNMHFSLLKNTEGISLERVRTNEPTQSDDNWRSASSASGFATPGLMNSQHLEDSTKGNEISVYPEIFTPDNDGKDDYLNISYRFDNPGNMATIVIFDAVGRSLKRIASNTLLGVSGTFTWDGLDENKNQPPTGIYLIYTEVVVPSAGKVLKYKKTCVLGGRF